MTNILGGRPIVVVLDLLIALFAFWLVRYFGDLPRWYWLVLSAVVWTIIGVGTQKLYFSSYQRKRHMIIALFTVDVLSGLLLYFTYREFVPDYEDYSILLATGIIFALECVLYYAIRLFVYRKIPYLYEEPEIKECIEKVGVRDDLAEERLKGDVATIIDALKEGNKNNIDNVAEKLRVETLVLETTNPEDINAIESAPQLMLHKMPLNNIRHINTLFAYTNYKLQDGGYIGARCQTAAIRREKIRQGTPKSMAGLINSLDYFFHRVAPKLPVLKKVYYWLTKGKRRVLTRVEVLGRLYRAGFDVIFEKIVEDEFFVVARKVKEPIRDDKPSNGVLIRLQRRGKNGKIIGVYKFRTMHAYSEYLQPYIYKTEGLSDGGKFADDYRVSKLGKYLRKTWLDELPMFINYFKGNLKLVGVRPLSNHYFSLYTKELQELRIKVKPGLLPPFYADMPKTLEDIEESEMRYIKAYLKAPFKTDWIYFWKCVKNIVFKGERSK